MNQPSLTMKSFMLANDYGEIFFARYFRFALSRVKLTTHAHRGQMSTVHVLMNIDNKSLRLISSPENTSLGLVLNLNLFYSNFRWIHWTWVTFSSSSRSRVISIEDTTYHAKRVCSFKATIVRGFLRSSQQHLKRTPLVYGRAVIINNCCRIPISFFPTQHVFPALLIKSRRNQPNRLAVFRSGTI